MTVLDADKLTLPDQYWRSANTRDFDFASKDLFYRETSYLLVPGLAGALAIAGSILYTGYRVGNAADSIADSIERIADAVENIQQDVHRVADKLVEILDKINALIPEMRGVFTELLIRESLADALTYSQQLRQYSIDETIALQNIDRLNDLADKIQQSINRLIALQGFGFSTVFTVSPIFSTWIQTWTLLHRLKPSQFAPVWDNAFHIDTIEKYRDFIQRAKELKKVLQKEFDNFPTKQKVVYRFTDKAIFERTQVPFQASYPKTSSLNGEYFAVIRNNVGTVQLHCMVEVGKAGSPPASNLLGWLTYQNAPIIVNPTNGRFYKYLDDFRARWATLEFNHQLSRRPELIEFFSQMEDMKSFEEVIAMTQTPWAIA